MTDTEDVLLSMYQHYSDVALHHQGQASTTSNIILVLAGAIAGLVTFDQEVGGTDILAAGVLVVLGLFGALWSAKHHERFDRYMTIADKYRRRLDELLPEADLYAPITKSEQQAPVLSHVRVRYLWMGLNLFVAVLGCLIAVFYFTSPAP